MNRLAMQLIILGLANLATPLMAQAIRIPPGAATIEVPGAAPDGGNLTA